MEEVRIKQLVILIKEGNLSYFDEFFNATKNQVFYNILSITKNRTISEDLLQETYIKFLNSINKVDVDSSILGFLMVMSRNITLDYFKKANKETIYEAINDFGEKDNDDSLDSNIVLNKAKKILNDKEFRILVLHSLNELTFEEIASLIKRPLGTVIWSYNNSIKKLRKELAL